MLIFGKDNTNCVVERAVKRWLKQWEADYIYYVKAIESDVLRTTYGYVVYVVYVPSTIWIYMKVLFSGYLQSDTKINF